MMGRGVELREIPLEEVRQRSGLVDYAMLAGIFNYPIVETADGTWRWRRSKLVDLFVHSGDTRFKVGMNDLQTAFFQGLFPVEEYMRFYMQMGVSLSHFGEVFGQHEAADWHLPGATPIPANHDGSFYIEDVITYVCRIYRGKMLRL